MANITIHRVESDDELRTWADIVGRVFVWGPPSIETTRHMRATQSGRLDLIASVADTAVGAATVHLLGESDDDAPYAPAGVWVVAESRRQGVGTALAHRLSAHARTLGKRELQVEAMEDDADTLRTLDRRGFREVERNTELALDLTTAEAPSASVPDGIQIVSRAQRPDLVEGMYQVAVEAIADIPGTEARGHSSFAEWRAMDIEHPERRPELCFIALHGDEVVAYAILQDGPSGVLFHGLTGVKRAWRQRGIASALKRTQIRAALAAGCRRLVTENVERNEPIRRLNQRFGYRQIPGAVLLRGPLINDDREHRH